MAKINPINLHMVSISVSKWSHKRPSVIQWKETKSRWDDEIDNNKNATKMKYFDTFGLNVEKIRDKIIELVRKGRDGFSIDNSLITYLNDKNMFLGTLVVSQEIRDRIEREGKPEDHITFISCRHYISLGYGFI